MGKLNQKGLRQKNPGFVMMVVMIVLTALGLSVLSVMELSTLDEKQAGNEQQKIRVDQVAVSELESQLRALKVWGKCRYLKIKDTYNSPRHS